MTQKQTHIFTEQSSGYQRVGSGGWPMSKMGPEDGNKKT